MLRVRKSTAGWAVALALTATGLTPASPAAARPQPSPTIDWRPCPKDATAECGTLSLPVDWDRPEGSASTWRSPAGSPPIRQPARVRWCSAPAGRATAGSTGS
ncbi:hypothetical protein GCM10027614_42660 [Micromonospora vulcania]